MRELTSSRILVVAGLIATGCGSSASPTTQYCQNYGKAICSKAYACTPAAMQSADFHNEWGPNEAACASGFTQLCELGCDKKQVSMTAETGCLSDLNAAACTTVTDGTLGASCDAVCIDAPAGMGGNSGGGPGGSSGGAPISDPIVFCTMSSNVICDRAFQCVPAASRDADFTTNYGASVAACKAMTPTTCVNPSTNCPRSSMPS